MIQEIMNLDDEDAISKIEQQIEALYKDHPFWAAIKPIQKGVTFEQMIEEPLEELLNAGLMN
ncbi:MAG: hypothetical protein IPJ74_23815 [Saprospiraceae bacterium]|nr:hypothetical protein [Saprospiraceae bacterium]